MDNDNTHEMVSSCVREEMNLPGKREGAPFCLAGVEIQDHRCGYLMKQGAFQRWNRKLVTVEDGKLLISKDALDRTGDFITLSEAVVTEASLKNTGHIFLIITSAVTLTLAASSRRELQQWMTSVRYSALRLKHPDPDVALAEMSRQHKWFVSNHASRTLCNVCGDALHGVAWNGLSCEVCRFKSHRRCAPSVTQGCKWTTRESIERDGERTVDNCGMPHQWLEGNLPTGSKCSVCQRACGSVMRLQDHRCIWCKTTVHTECKENVKGEQCTLGQHQHFIVPPFIVKKADSVRKGLWEPCDNKARQNPCVALVNSRSGDNQGVRFLRRFKQLLNPLQVYDIATCGPELPLILFKHFHKCSVLVCGGDGSFGWVLATLDRLDMHDQCMMGTVPLGTGNDLSRVLGWGRACDDDQKLPAILHEMELSGVRMLDRWSVQRSPLVIENEEHSSRESSPPSHASSPDVFGESSPDDERQKVHVFDIPPPGGRATWPMPRQQHHSDSPEHPETLSNEGSESTTDADKLDDPSGSEGDQSSSCEMDEDRTHPMVRMCSSNELDVDQDLPVVPGRATGTEFPPFVEHLQDSLSAHLSRIMLSKDDAEVISSSEVLCSELKKVTKSVLEVKSRQLSQEQVDCDPLVQKCVHLDSKLESMIETLRSEVPSSRSSQEEEKGATSRKFLPREALMARADSLKKAAQSLIDQATDAIEAQELATAEIRALAQQAIMGQPLLTRPNYLPSVSKDATLSVQSPVNGAEGGQGAPGELHEVAAMNNYFGIGLDAKITYEFHTRREENPKQYTSRAKNIVLFGLLGGKEMLQGSQRGFENRVRLECDGKVMKLPRGVQGIVALNIPSYMAGTNFWGTERSTGQFSAPSIDDKLMEVVAITGANIATTKVFKFQFSNHRIAQCRSLRMVIEGKEKVPMQVDGEAWLQEPGVIMVTHKNKARMIVKDKAFSHSLHSWNQANAMRRSTAPSIDRPKQVQLVNQLDEGQLQNYKNLVFTTRTLISCLKVEAQQNADVKTTLLPIAIETTRAINVVFPDDKVSESATSANLTDMQMEIKRLLQETHWFVNMKKVSQDYEIVVKDAVQRVEGVMRRILYPKQHGDESKDTVAPLFRHSSDSQMVVGASSNETQSGCTLAAYYHRQRSQQMEKVITTNTKTYCVEDVKTWNIGQVCEWLEEISFGQYSDQFKAHEIRGQELVALQKSDLMDMGITKVGHLAQLRKQIQNFQEQQALMSQTIAESMP